MTEYDSDASDEQPATEEGSCCGTCDDAGPAFDGRLDSWTSGQDILAADLPTDMQVALGSLLGRDSVETLEEWVGEVRRRTGGGSIAVDDLCHARKQTEHWGEMDGDRYHFLCFYDAVILSALVDEPVDVRTVSPDGAVIEAHAAGTDDLTVAPEDAVFSFGGDESAAAPTDGSPTFADVYQAVCPYVRAFPDMEAYTRWANAVPAVTVAMPLDDATEVAAALVQ